MPPFFQALLLRGFGGGKRIGVGCIRRRGEREGGGGDCDGVRVQEAFGDALEWLFFDVEEAGLVQGVWC
jgi:hypothetical protein